MSAALEFLGNTEWKDAALEPITGDASPRRYFRLRKGKATAILMDASRVRETVAPFIGIDAHLLQLGFSAPKIFARDLQAGYLLLEDFGDETFSRLLEDHFDPEEMFAMATDVLAALHQRPGGAPDHLRVYTPQQMLADAELFLDVHEISGRGEKEFAKAWLEVLPLAHEVPASLLLRDYHAANLMRLPGRKGIRRVGLLDFQDAYRGPVTYDLVSLLEDARRDLPPGLKDKMISRYFSQFSGSVNLETFKTSLAILAALRHTRVLAVFEKLNREGKSDYQRLHSPRVKHLLHQALRHPKLAALRNWFANHAL